MNNLLIRNAQLRDEKELKDILILDGKFSKIEAGIPAEAAAGGEVIDAAGCLVSPPFVDPHVHLDAVLSASQMPRQNETGTLIEAIGIWNDWRPGLTKEVLKKNAREVVDWYIANGTLRVRTHADCTDPTLLTVECLCELREEVKDLIDIQVVAFPQNGILTNPNHIKLFERAIEMGADVLGGAPHLELTREDGVREIEIVYEYAEKYGKLIDVHCDETGDPDSKFVEVMAKESILRGMGERSSASHTTAMHNYNPDYAFKLIGNLAKAKMSIVTNPIANANLQNRLEGYPRKRGLARIDDLHARGVNVCIGNDSVMDPWYSLGRASILDTAYFVTHYGHLVGAAQLPLVFDMTTVNSAKALALEDYGIKPGNQADMIILDAKNISDVIRLRSECTCVIRKGKVISTATPARRVLYNGRNMEFRV